MNVVADAVQTLQRVYQNASLAICADVPQRTADIRQTIITDGDAAFKALGKDQQSVFLVELASRVNACCGNGTMTDEMITKALEKQTLDVDGLVPLGLRQFPSHVRHALKWALPQTLSLAA